MDATETQELRARFRGELVVPGDVAYDGARKVDNGMIDRRPALIVKCADVADDPENLFRVNQNINPGDR